MIGHAHCLASYQCKIFHTDQRAIKGGGALRTQGIITPFGHTRKKIVLDNLQPIIIPINELSAKSRVENMKELLWASDVEDWRSISASSIEELNVLGQKRSRDPSPAPSLARNDDDKGIQRMSKQQRLLIKNHRIMLCGAMRIFKK
ncbi:18074_t:CDS:2 [Funneliformis geosporum]|nr:18074_t:CDS:2 [Funneliformis geosporum]